MQTIYLCGGINGLTDAQCKDWRDEVKRQLAGPFYILDPMRRDFRGKEDIAVKEIVEGDIEDIDKSDILIVNAEKPSWGTAMEVFYAFQKKKTIITVCPDRVSPWLRYHSTSIVKNIPEAIGFLKGLLFVLEGPGGN